MDFELITNKDPDTFEKDVLALLRKLWKPFVVEAKVFLDYFLDKLN